MTVGNTHETKVLNNYFQMKDYCRFGNCKPLCPSFITDTTGSACKKCERSFSNGKEPAQESKR